MFIVKNYKIRIETSHKYAKKARLGVYTSNSSTLETVAGRLQMHVQLNYSTRSSLKKERKRKQKEGREGGRKGENCEEHMI